MPGSITTVSGLIERQLGRGVVANSALQRVGKGGAMAAGGGNITVNVTAANTSGNTNDTTEDVIFTQTLPANTLDVIGRQVVIEMYGSFPTTQTATRNLRLYFGSTVLQNFAATTGQTGAVAISAYVTKAGANSQSILVLVDNAVTGSTVRAMSVTSATETDTAGIIIKVTGQTATALANMAVCNGLIIGGYN